ncbi:MAG: MFS transporter [Paludibacterium sp.]|uniref:MFS transporter n=1 Tax=Paludibacterium sp. TaxID=1917523 RepID=UPI0025DFB865|nr:MFS transporter [Paludibacterium sp.]MBV8045555.1 MFS transporter [Paludibacterium sp.]MBV8645850.1 MFS transporter [Paludibacterium sp.]
MLARHQAFFYSLFVSRLADQILLFLVPLVIFQTTRQVSWSGMAFAIEALPRYLCFPFLGLLCDRHAPTRLLHVSQSFRALTCVLGIGAYTLWGGIGWLIGLSALCGMLTSLGVVTREVMLPQLFGGQRFERVLSYAQLADQLGLVLGPMLAAQWLTWWHWQGIVVGAAGLFLAADMALAHWQRTSRFVPRQPAVAPRRWRDELGAAFGHIARLPALRALVMLAAAENLIIGVTLATSAAMVNGIHGQTAAVYAGLQAAGAGATVAVLLVTARWTGPRHLLGLTGFAAILLGALATAMSPGIAGYAIGFVLIVGFDKMFSVYIRGARQRVIPADDYGKTTGMIIFLNNLTQPLAGLGVALFARPLGTRPLLLLLTLAMALLGALAAPKGLANERSGK